MNSQSDSRSRLYPKYSFGSGASSGGFASFPSPFFSGSMTRLKPVPTGSTKTRSVKASHDDSFSTSRAGIAGNVPSDGKSTRCGPTAPMCRYAEEAPGPPLKTKVTGRPPSSPPATYETEKISAAGFSFLRRTLHFAVAVYWIAFLPRPHASGRLGTGRRLVVGLRLALVVLRVVAHGRARYRLPGALPHNADARVPADGLTRRCACRRGTAGLARRLRRLRRGRLAGADGG